MTTRTQPEPLAALLARLGDALPDLVDETCTRIYRDQESYAGVDREALVSSVERNLGIALAALRAGRAPTPDRLPEAEQTARERHAVGVPVEEIIRAFRVSISLIYEAFLSSALSVGMPMDDVTRGSRVLWDVGDAFTTRVVTTYHDLDLGARLADARRRTAAVRSILAGESPADPAWYALDPHHRYAAVHCAVSDPQRAEAIRRLLEETGSLPGFPALVVLDEDACLGMVATTPKDPPYGLPVGLGPFVFADEMPRSDRTARLALQVARRLGRSGVQGIDDLQWRLAAVSRPDVWRRYAQVFLRPLEPEGSFGLDLLAAVRAWLRHGRSMQRAADALTVHVNTMRYRLARYQDLTGCDYDNPDDLVGLIWVVELGDPDREPL
jgi:putative transposase